jgi:hypothetical protein
MEQGAGRKDRWPIRPILRGIGRVAAKSLAREPDRVQNSE